MIGKSIYINVHFNIGVPLLAEDTFVPSGHRSLTLRKKKCQANPSKLYKTRCMFHHRKFWDFWRGFNQFQLILNIKSPNVHEFPDACSGEIMLNPRNPHFT
jgi:hypothetical protein